MTQWTIYSVPLIVLSNRSLFVANPKIPIQSVIMFYIVCYLLVCRHTMAIDSTHEEHYCRTCTTLYGRFQQRKHPVPGSTHAVTFIPREERRALPADAKITTAIWCHFRGNFGRRFRSAGALDSSGRALRVPFDLSTRSLMFRSSSQIL